MARNEKYTRKDLIDPALRKAGWDVDDHTQVKHERPLHKLTDTKWKGFIDYALLRENGEVLAIVEAKREGFDSSLAQQQTEFYLNEEEKRQSFRPFAFMADGRNIYFYVQGESAKRRVYGFFSREDLERMLSLKQTKKPLAQQKINTDITNRPYQIEAIKRISQSFDEGKRKALLVMATGTGKTRTAMSLIDVFLKANQARHVLFVADRDALVSQALHEGFESFLEEPATRLFGTSFSKPLTARLYVATLQTLSNHFQRMTPGFFDLIVFDEVHRSIFNKWNEVLEYFDARMIGLTATPADYIDRNTFIEFGCYDGSPTFLYTYEDAIKEGYLVDYRLYRAKTNFQEQGIRGQFLDEEQRNALIEAGQDPDLIDFEGTDLEKDVVNLDTYREQWQEIMEVALRDQPGQAVGKTIVFAISQEHAVRLERSFNEMYPQYPDWARVITYKSEYKGQLIERFKKEDNPRIAISVSMLETGVNVPEVVNLVFMRPVQSPISLMQMVGRGTRNNEACTFKHRLPDGEKSEFLIIDFWENDFNRTAQDAPAQSLPVAVSLFNTRLKLLEHWLDDQYSDVCQRLIADLRTQIAEIPLDSFSVQRVLNEVAGVEEAWEDHFWEYLTFDRVNLLRMNVAPLLRYVPAVDVASVTFTHKVERIKLRLTEDKDIDSLISTLREDVTRLPQFVRQDTDSNDAIRFTLSRSIENATVEDLNDLIDALADKMRHRRAKPNPLLVLDLNDFIASRGFVTIESTGEEMYVAEYRDRVEQHILDLVKDHPTVQAIEDGKELDDIQLIQLERTLRQQLSALDIEDNLKRIYGAETMSLLSLLRRLLELDVAALPDYQDLVKRQFDSYIENHHPVYTDDQIRFLRAVKSVFLRRGRLSINHLYDDQTLIVFGDSAIDRLFSQKEVDQLLDFALMLDVTA